MGLFDLFNIGSKKNTHLKQLYENGAVIIDVRTPEEYASGHIEGSHNVPLQVIKQKVNKIKKLNKPVITCCRSGMRSAQAANILQNAGIECYNGGGWTSLNKIISQ
jgi:rhodanese-related sulfurtransferase